MQPRCAYMPRWTRPERSFGGLGPWGQPQGIVRAVGGSRRTAALPSAGLLQPHCHVATRQDTTKTFAREEHTAGPFVHTPAYCYDPDDPNFGFDEFDDQTCLGGGDWGDFVDDSGG